jgi:hypothetical protein
MEDYGLRIKKDGGRRPGGADAPWAQKIVDGIWKMGLSRTKPLGSGAKGAWEGGLIIRGQRG